jgi:hypothetical protein
MTHAHLDQDNPLIIQQHRPLMRTTSEIQYIPLCTEVRELASSSDFTHERFFLLNDAFLLVEIDSIPLSILWPFLIVFV